MALLQQQPNFGLFEMDQQGEFVSLSDAVNNVMGQSVKGTSGGGWMQQVHPDDIDEVVAQWQAYIESGSKLPYEKIVQL